MKTKKITLVVPGKNMERDFDPDHAKALLEMPNNGGWQKKEDANSSGNKRKAGKEGKEVRN